MIYHGQPDLSDLESVVTRTVQAFEPKRKRFDSIVVTGMSGVVVGVPVALRLGMPVVIIRKPDDAHHYHYGGRFINADAIGARWLLLDDFTDSGRTLKRVKEAIESGIEMYLPQTKYAGAYFYGSCRNDDGKPDGFRWPRKPRTAPQATETVPVRVAEPAHTPAPDGISAAILSFALTGNSYLTYDSSGILSSAA